MGIVFSFLLIGCGGGSSSSSTSSLSNNDTTVQNEQSFSKTGTVVDPYIEGATFFYDKNKNGIHAEGELLSSKSDKQGKFTFTTSEDIPIGARIVMKDQGTHQHH